MTAVSHFKLRLKINNHVYVSALFASLSLDYRAAEGQWKKYTRNERQ